MTSSVQSTAQTEQVSNKQLGIMVGFLVSLDWFKNNLDDSMYYGTVTKDSDSDSSRNVQGYNYISAHGDNSRFIYYKWKEAIQRIFTELPPVI